MIYSLEDELDNISLFGQAWRWSRLLRRDVVNQSSIVQICLDHVLMVKDLRLSLLNF